MYPESIQVMEQVWKQECATIQEEDTHSIIKAWENQLALSRSKENTNSKKFINNTKQDI